MVKLAETTSGRHKRLPGTRGGTAWKPATDVMHRMQVDAREAIGRVGRGDGDKFWFECVPLILDELPFLEPVRGTEIIASLTLNDAERRLFLRGYPILGLTGELATETAGDATPLSLTLAEWMLARASLARAFCRTPNKYEERRLERLIMRIEDLIVAERPSGQREAGSHNPAGT